jgi:hypothetical protein
MSTNRTDVVGEYLREVELRLGGLPLLQRRELLADLEAHIAEARLNAHSEGELIEILERLGSPEVVAAAAYEEAGLQSGQGWWRGGRTGGPVPPHTPVQHPTPVRRGWPPWVIVLVAVGALMLVLLLCGAFFAARSSTSEPNSVPGEAPPAPTAPR